MICSKIISLYVSCATGKKVNMNGEMLIFLLLWYLKMHPLQKIHYCPARLPMNRIVLYSEAKMQDFIQVPKCTPYAPIVY